MPNARRPTDNEPDGDRSSILALLDQVAEAPGVDAGLARLLAPVRHYLSKPDSAKGPFLTVLLRTQGKRIEPLKDALLCLCAQTDQDFEVVVIAHDATPPNAVLVRGALASLQPDFARRVSLVEVAGGTRAKPLNAGLDAANGQYIAVFDDDDLVFANWIEEFHLAAANANGRLLRALVSNQSVTPEVWPGGASGFRTSSLPRVEFPSYFSAAEHLLVNASPFMTWAFPRSLFRTFGVRFDEELTVCEDWDVILRGSLLCGVKELAASTSIYRRWQDGESSYTSHSSAAWTESERRVIDRMNESVLLLPQGSVPRLRHLALAGDAWQKYHYIFNGNTLRQPLQSLWDLATPAGRLMRRVVRRARRARGR
jgi:hypothetical protein